MYTEGQQTVTYVNTNVSYNDLLAIFQVNLSQPAATWYRDYSISKIEVIQLLKVHSHQTHCTVMAMHRTKQCIW